MVCELGGDGRGVDAGRLEVVILVAQHADDFRRQCLVENLDHGFSVGLVAFGDRTLLDVLARAAPNVLDIGDEWLGTHGGSLAGLRSEEHTSELQSLMRISYAVFCLKKKN